MVKNDTEQEEEGAGEGDRDTSAVTVTVCISQSDGVHVKLGAHYTPICTISCKRQVLMHTLTISY